MNIDVTFPRHTVNRAKGHRVYLREHWFDEWVKIPWLYAEEVVFSIAPQIGEAHLAWQFGYGMRPGELTPKIVQRLTGKKRQFVKIELDAFALTLNPPEEVEEEEEETGPAPLVWYGTIEIDGTEALGLLRRGSNWIETGRQPLIALAIEQVLFRHPMRTSVWLQKSLSTEHIAERCFTFNAPDAVGRAAGNRSDEEGPSGVFVFSDQLDEEDETWSSREILRYLIKHHMPRGRHGIEIPYFTIEEDALDLVPDFDEPIISTLGKTVGDVLNELMPRERMLSWRLEVAEAELAERNTIRIVPIPLLQEDVETELGKYKANPRQLTLKADLAADVRVACKESGAQTVDQVRMRGAIRTTTCSLAHADTSIDEGWPLALELEYNTGGSEEEDYDTADVYIQQQWNDQVRSSDRLAAVYRRFAIPRTWNQRVKNGLGSGTAYAVFLKNPPNQIDLKMVNPRELIILPTLPLKDGFDYTDIGSLTLRTDPVKVSDGPHNPLPPLVVFQDPTEPTHYVQVEKIGESAVGELYNADRNRLWSGQVEVPQHDRAVLIHVHGQPQHVLAYTDFEQLPVDEYIGAWDWRDAIFTVCLRDDRHAEGVWPPEEDANAEVIGLRRDLVLYAGSRYRQDYLVPGTVIGINKATRGLVRCDAGGWINDDREILTARARQAYEYYRQARLAIDVQTPLVNAQIRPGDLVKTWGQQSPRAVGTVISTISVTIPRAIDGEVTDPPIIRYTTAFAELDVVQFVSDGPEGASA